MSSAVVDWEVWGCAARLVVTDPAVLSAAHARVVRHLAAVDTACSRFRPDSEIRMLERAHGQETEVSALLARHLDAALTAAHRTDGDLDPTVGSVLVALGYDRDIGDLTDYESEVLADETEFTTCASWAMISLHERIATVPARVHLDLGATAKALAADDGARQVADEFGCGALLALGGDIATAGPAPHGGWRIRVEDRSGDPVTAVSLPARAAIATSSTQRRRWGRDRHHIIDVCRAAPAEPVWRTVTVAADTCVAANTVTTACVIRGWAALKWLRELGLPARLVDHTGRVHTVGPWPTTGSSTA